MRSFFLTFSFVALLSFFVGDNNVYETILYYMSLDGPRALVRWTSMGSAFISLFVGAFFLRRSAIQGNCFWMIAGLLAPVIIETIMVYVQAFAWNTLGPIRAAAFLIACIMAVASHEGCTHERVQSSEKLYLWLVMSMATLGMFLGYGQSTFFVLLIAIVCGRFIATLIYKD